VLGSRAGRRTAFEATHDRCDTWCYTIPIPTNRPRHTITEVGPVADALERVRSVAGEADVRELVVLGADAFVKRAAEDRATSEQRAALRERLIARTVQAGTVDREAATSVREHGWARDGDG
jgi:hypothetical protein